MTASLVTLFRQRRGWTNEDRAQFARIERLLEEAGFAVDVEHGLSDEGEPWCVFCSRVTGDVVIHVACIDGRFMFDSTTLPRPIEGATFRRCAERFFEDVSLPMPLAERRGKVYLHPSAMLASLFITVLLYAQATTEAPLFEAEAVDVDDPDAPPTEQNPLAVRLKAIAQQVSDFVAAGENTQAGAQSYAPAAVAAIPAGMAIAVIAIAQDLAAAHAAGLLGAEEDPELLPSATAQTPDADQAAPVTEVAVQTGEKAENGGRVVHDLSALSGAPSETEAEALVEAALEADIAALAGLFGEAISDFGAAAGDAAEIVDALAFGILDVDGAGTLLGDVMPIAKLAEVADTAETPAMSALFEEIVNLGSVASVADTIEVAGRTVAFEVIHVTESVAEQLEVAFLAITDFDDEVVIASGAPDGLAMDSFDLVLTDTLAPEPTLGPLPAQAFDQPAIDIGRPNLEGQRSTGDGSVSWGAGRGNETPAPGSGIVVAVVSDAERNALVERFAAEVGDFTVVKSETTEWYFDASLNNYTRTENIEFDTFWLEDGTKVTFAGAAWDFDGLV